MHGVVARQRIVQYLSCALIYSLLSAQDKNILKGGTSVCQSLKRSLGVPVWHSSRTWACLSETTHRLCCFGVFWGGVKLMNLARDCCCHCWVAERPRLDAVPYPSPVLQVGLSPEHRHGFDWNDPLGPQAAEREAEQPQGLITYSRDWHWAMGNAHVASSHFVSYFASPLYTTLLKQGKGGCKPAVHAEIDPLWTLLS